MTDPLIVRANRSGYACYQRSKNVFKLEGHAPMSRDELDEFLKGKRYFTDDDGVDHEIAEDAHERIESMVIKIEDCMERVKR